jgi:hypothetical protein
LVAKGKAKMVALIALAHKILTIASAVVKKKEPWEQNYSKQYPTPT